MLGVNVALSVALIFFGSTCSIWSILRIAERYARGRFWMVYLPLALIGALPELMMGIMANTRGLGIVAIGTPLGSSIINLLLLGGIASAISPTRAHEPFPTKSAWAIAAASILVMAVAAAGRLQSQLGIYSIPRWGGLLLIAAFAAMTPLMRESNVDNGYSPRHTPKPKVHVLWLVLALVAGVGLVTQGASLTAKIALAYIENSGSAQNAIGLIGLAAIAALPEATASVYLALHKQTATAFSNLMNSTIANLLLILGIVATVAPLPAYDSLPTDLGFTLLGALLVLGAVALGKGRRVSRGEGITLILLYALFALLVLLRQEGSANLFF